MGSENEIELHPVSSRYALARACANSPIVIMATDRDRKEIRPESAEYSVKLKVKTRQIQARKKDKASNKNERKKKHPAS